VDVAYTLRLPPSPPFLNLDLNYQILTGFMRKKIKSNLFQIDSLANKRNISSDFEKIFQYAKRQTELESYFLKEELTDNLNLLKKYKDSDIEEYFLSFLIIRAITYFEISMTSITKYLVDSLDPDLSLLFREEWKIPTSRIHEILNQKLKKSDMVLASFNFQYLPDVDFIFSKLLKLDFLETVRGMHEIESNHFVISSAKNLNKNWDKFDKIFETRHLIVHTWYLPGKRRFDFVESLIGSVIDFVSISIFLAITVEMYHQGKLKEYPELQQYIHERLQENKVKSN
jgi:hypothetical protein